MKRLFIALALLTITVSANAQQRAVRRDIPITNWMRKAYQAGTRDSTGRPGKNYWQTSVEYSIDAKLEPSTSIVTGRETITLNNNGTTPMTAIVFRLDQNIYRANVARLEEVPEITDGMNISKLVINGATIDINLPSVARGFNSTVGTVRLPMPIAPNSSAKIDVEWSFKVPRVPSGRGLRMGSMGDSIFQVAQWYPRVAEYDDYRGWDTEPYLGPSEFNNNFGKFDVRLDVPTGWLIGATGVLQNPEQTLSATARQRLAHVLETDSITHIVTADERVTPTAQRVTWHFAADSVADFAWATSRTYVFDATRATIPGKGPVPVYLFFPPSQQTQYNNAARLASHALEFYSKQWMPYAFPQLTLSFGPELGMEYPMFIMSGQGAADHETGHEWAPMMVGVNETWWGWMDEGFNQYQNILSANDRNKVALNTRLDSLGMRYGNTSGNEMESPLIWNENFAGPVYAFNAYGKAPLMLSSLGGIVGDTAVWRAMSEYMHAWRFKKPTPWDFAFFMNNALKQDLGWFWNSWIFETDAVHGSIESVKATGTKYAVTVRQDGQMPSPVILKVDFADKTSKTVTWPVDVWFSGARTVTRTLSFGKKIEKITLDPNGRFPDRDPKDNVWPR